MHAITLRIFLCLVAALFSAGALPAQDLADPYLWLEDVDSERALTWVRERNDKSGGELIGREFDRLEERLLGILDSEEKIPYVSRMFENLV